MTNSQYQSIKKKILFVQEDIDRLTTDLTDYSDKLYELYDQLATLLREIASCGIAPDA